MLSRIRFVNIDSKNELDVFNIRAPVSSVHSLAKTLLNGAIVKLQ